MTEPAISKRCSKCKQIKPLSEFYKDHGKKDGHRNYCKSCQKDYDQSEKGKAREKRYRQSLQGKTKRKEYAKSAEGKASHKRHRQSEKFKATRKRYRQTEKCKKNQIAAIKHFRIRHPEQRKAKDAVNYAIKTGRLIRPDTLQCHYCPAQAKQYHHHKGYEHEHWLHVIPVCLKCHGKITHKT